MRGGLTWGGQLLGELYNTVRHLTSLHKRRTVHDLPSNCIPLVRDCIADLPHPPLTAPPRAACTYASVEQLNRDEIGPILDDIVQTPFFRYFKVDLYCDCPFWPDDGMCAMRQVE